MAAPDGPLGVYFLDVGQGDCTFIVAPDGTTVLVDCNDAYVARRFLEDHRLERIHAVVVTHLDLDHLRGVLPLLKAWLESGKSVGQLYIGRDRFAAGIKTNAAILIEQALAWEKAGRLELCSPFREGQPKDVATGLGWSIRIVAPRYSAQVSHDVRGRSEPNELSAVVRVERSGSAVLIGGDATFGSWEAMDPADRCAKVIRTPHHGGDILQGAASWTSYPDLYAAVAPEAVAFSVGTHNRHGHPLEEHVKAPGPSCLRLCTQLTARCEASVASHRTRALDQHGRVEFPYRHRIKSRGDRHAEVPCAGSIGVFVDSAGRIEYEPPQRGWHERFVASLSSPLCRT
jgi:beta-lactamase superfamily II metal-dependent hydrolase